MTFFIALGSTCLALLQETGRATLFAFKSIRALFHPPWFWGQILQQIIKTGFFSIPVIGLTALFTGGALALNIYTGGTRFNAEQFVPNIVVVGLTRELGPVLAALMLTGRVSAAIAAEIGSMRVTEQIDALFTLSTDPFQYLMVPRLIAATLFLPVLVLIADVVGVMGGFLVATQSLDFNGVTYLRNTLDFVTQNDILTGLIKAAVFGFIIALMGCYHGFYAGRSAVGVGRATTYAVVSAAILIFASNYILTTLFV